MIAGRRIGASHRPFQTLFTLGSAGGLDDDELLARFVAGEGDAAQAAFAVLVDRHGAMVWRACLAVLRDRHEAEDAFQAAFLVLALKAKSLRVRGTLAPWLHRVACRTASGLRTSVARRRKHERRYGERSEPTGATRSPLDPDRDAAIHEELARLPEKLRAPIVLCDLQGRTHAEAAKALGWPPGTVKSRQARGRRLIRDRLARRGIGPAAAGLAVAAPPRAVVEAAVLQSVSIAAASHVLPITRGVLNAMLWTKLRSLATVVAAAGFAVGGAGAYVRGHQEPSPGDDPRPSASAPADSGGSRAVPGKDRKAHREALEARRLATLKAEALHEIARWKRIVAELSLEEYETVVFPRDLATAEDRVKSAETESSRQSDRRDWAARMFDKRYVSKNQLDAVTEDAEQAGLALQLASMNRDALKSDRLDRKEKLRLDIEKSRADEAAAKLTWERARALETTLERQVP